MTRSYHHWCERRGTPGDCLSLLGEGFSLGLEARRTLALSIALGSVWEGAVGEWKGMVDPVALQSLVMSAMAGYLAMLVLPNPVTQAAALSFSCFMVAYLGLDKMQLGVRLAEIGQVQQIAIGQASFTLTLAPGALAMASQGTNGGGASTRAPSEAARTGAPSKYRLKFIESWRKPRLTEDGKILPYPGTRNPPNPIPNLGRSRAGQTVTDGDVTLRFDKNGFPEFDTKFETILDDSHIGSERPELHIRAANRSLFDAIKADPGLAKELGLSPTNIEQLLTLDRAPRGYIWHHHQDVCRMQLVQEDAHILSRPHTGGMAIWGGGY